MRGIVLVMLCAGMLLAATMFAAPRAAAARPEYEAAYVGGTTVWINAIEMRQVAPLEAQADLYLVIRHTFAVPPGIGTQIGSVTPQCNPCDHFMDGPSFDDYHDHVLDSIPSSPGGHEFSPLWHVFVILPAPGHETAYAAAMPATSESAVEALVDAGDAVMVDTHFYFLCAVVSVNAAP